MLSFKAFKPAMAFDGLGKLISFPAVGSSIAIAGDGSGSGLVSPDFAAKVAGASLDKMRSKYVAAAIFWCTRASDNTPAAFEIEINSAKPCVAHRHYQVAELEFAHRVASFLIKPAGDGGMSKEDGELFASWLVNHMPAEEVYISLYRPWNKDGIKGFKCTDDDFTPLAFSAPDADGAGAGSAAGGAGPHGMLPINPFDNGASVANRFFGSEQAYGQLKVKEYRGRIEMIFGSPLQLWVQPAMIEQLIKLCAAHLPDRLGSEATKFFSLSTSSGSSQLSVENLGFRRQAALAALIAEVKPESRTSLVGAMHAFAATMSCPGGNSQWLGVSHPVASATAALVHATAVYLNDMLHWKDRALHFSLEETYAFIATVLVERILVPAYETQDEAKCVEQILSVSNAADIKELIIQFRNATRTNSGSRPSGKRHADESDESASSSDEASSRGGHSSASAKSSSKSSSGGGGMSKKGKPSKLCYYFNEKECKDGDKCSFDHSCSYCSIKNGKSHGHPRTKCEVQKRAGDASFKTPGPKDSSH